MKNKKRGFTIVELVIVIAVIGILSAVLIPTFSGLVAKANLANDNVLVRNINTQLAAAEIKDGKNVTMYDALQDAKEAGYLVANINARSQNQLVWDSTIDRFALIDAEGKVVAGETTKNVKDVDLWQICDTVDGNEKYSVYASNDFNKTDVTISVGFDAGEKQGIKNVSYVNNGEGAEAQTVVIRTNSLDTTLSVDAKLDTVYHYGKNGSTVIRSVNTASFHEFGYVPFVEIAGGNLVIEASAEVKALHFNATGEGNQAKFQNADGLKISVDMSNVQAEYAPKLSRDNVAVGQDVLVAKVDSDFIWLTGNGTSAEIKVSKTETGTKAAATGALAEVADQIANVAVEVDGQVTYEAKTTKAEAAEVVEEAKTEEVIAEAEAAGKTYVARVGAVGYETFVSAIQNAKNGEKVVLLADEVVDTTSNVFIRKNLVIDLNGKTLTRRDNANGFIISEANVDFVDNSEQQDGRVVNETENGKCFHIQIGSGVNIYAGTYESGYITVLSNNSDVNLLGGKIASTLYGVYNLGDSHFVVDGGKIETADYAVLQAAQNKFVLSDGEIKSENNDAIYLYNQCEFEINGGKIYGGRLGVCGSAKGSTVRMNGGEIESVSAGVALFSGDKFYMVDGSIKSETSFGVSNNGTSTNEPTIMQISGGRIESEKAAALYHAGKGTLTITGNPEFVGVTGIEIRAGQMTMTGGTVTGNGVPLDTKPNGNGSTTVGAGIAIVQHTTKLELSVSISGGTINGYTGLYESNVQNNADEDLQKITINVTGGTFQAINGGENAISIEDAGVVNVSISGETRRVVESE
jgi:prepilin-type N-terminal cleavage/methylation domain-containing protein